MIYILCGNLQKYEDPELQDMFQMRLASLDLKSQKRRVREIVLYSEENIRIHKLG